MAPPAMIDTTSDFSATPQRSTGARTLLLAPPSISSHPEALDQIFEAHDRNATDIQMLDRLAMGLVSLPVATYDLILLLTDVGASMSQSGRLLDRNVMEKLVQALKNGGKLRAQDGHLPSAEETEAILAGLMNDGAGGMTKPAAATEQTVKLSFGKKKANAAAVPANAVEAANTGIAALPTKEAKIVAVEEPKAPAGVGFIDFSDDIDMDYDDEEDDEYIPSREELLAGDSIDPDTLLTEEDRQRPIIIPQECKPNGKRRRACKDCTCGLKQKIEAEDAEKRVKADQSLQTMKLGADDLNELDFTVQGKVGSCGNCALGDAFRCDGCPYIGLPAFKPGEEVRLLNNDIQL